MNLDAALSLLQQTYGYDTFRGQQAEAIGSALEGRDSLVLMPTGGGKSLCYQIPAQLRPGTAIIVSPLIALMQDQVSALIQLGIKAAYLNSTLSREQQQQVTREFAQGQLQMLYIAPERLLKEKTLAYLSRQPISLIAIDEAHCVSQWGHDFRQDYLGLGILKQHFPNTPLMALTATADQRTQDEIVERLQLSNPLRLCSSFDRPNIRYSVSIRQDARKQLIRFLAQHKDEAGIVYCLSRKKVESTAEWLCSRGLVALPYHAGLDAKVRERHQQRFLREDNVIIVATIAFGMGIDKPDVRFVFHMDLPKSIEAYYQETGRAGRDGEVSEAYMIYGLQDVVRLNQMLNESQMSDQQKQVERHKLNALLGWCEITYCRRQGLLNYFEEDAPKFCGNCDVCVNPPGTKEATVDAQKFLSTVYRSGQRFGVSHIIDILRGADTDKIRQHGHEQLSTYGIGVDLSTNQWQSIARQLLMKGYLYNDFERFGALGLNESSRALLRGDIDFHCREQVAEVETRKKPRPAANGVSEEDRQLWEALRECRKNLAVEHDLAPYMVFHDATLMQMMEERPCDRRSLAFVHGVGASKLEKFGDAFLEVIAEFS
ncbi:DNA helicase RecQ [Pseudomaricurvus alkylphenolicus]|uniref:DNA helicase RecQ n=1 Tax=Pseudomaricurvus alkylphenolicus TaxID=1306991 RepID=UPI00141F7178|nr:DNA helicase RecQ [Pseudomaricurvus alkylphenolicus]NIB44569.1 DNA helicase RecQ [Pseudomaricurvus alkylphenolicus]